MSIYAGMTLRTPDKLSSLRYRDSSGCIRHSAQPEHVRPRLSYGQCEIVDRLVFLVRHGLRETRLGYN
jgi:hypothetical protein